LTENELMAGYFGSMLSTHDITRTSVREMVGMNWRSQPLLLATLGLRGRPLPSG